MTIMKTLYHWFQRRPIDNKAKEIQISWAFSITATLTLDMSLQQSFGSVYFLAINILNLIEFNISKTEKQDHAGFTFHIHLLGLDIDYNNRDVRHWDYANDRVADEDTRRE